MKCIKCHKGKASVFLAHLNHLCTGCAAHIIEKRIRKYVRMSRLIQRNDVIWTADRLAGCITKGIVKGTPVKWLKKKEKMRNILKNSRNVKAFIRKNGIRKVIISRTLDDEIAAFMKRALENGQPEKDDKKIVPLLIKVTDQEAGILAKHHKVQFKPNQENREIKDMLDRMEERYPETKFSLLKSAEKIKEMGI